MNKCAKSNFIKIFKSYVSYRSLLKRNKIKMRYIKVDHQVTTPIAKPNVLSFIPGTSMVEKDN